MPKKYPRCKSKREMDNPFYLISYLYFKAPLPAVSLSKKQPFEIKEIFDENNEKWLYYKNWMVEENACSERSLSSRIGSPLENGFTQNDLKVKEIKTFELPISIDSDEHKKIWVIKIEEINKQYSNKGFVEAEMVEEVEKKNVNPNNKLFKYVARAELHHQEWQEK